jgi:hypothetical protein
MSVPPIKSKRKRYLAQFFLLPIMTIRKDWDEEGNTAYKKNENHWGQSSRQLITNFTKIGNRFGCEIDHHDSNHADEHGAPDSRCEGLQRIQGGVRDYCGQL